MQKPTKLVLELNKQKIITIKTKPKPTNKNQTSKCNSRTKLNTILTLSAKNNPKQRQSATKQNKPQAKSTANKQKLHHTQKCLHKP